MTVHPFPIPDPSKFTPTKLELTNPKARGAADALDPALPWDGNELTPFQQDKVTWFDKQSELICSQAQAETEAVELDIKQVAAPIDSRGIFTSTIKNVEQVREIAKSEFETLVTELAIAAKDKAEFEAREERPTGVEAVYALQPNRGLIFSTFTTLVILESAFLATLIGPFAPGGRVQAFAYSLAGGLILGGLSFAIGGFGLRAWNVANPVRRVAARLTVFIGVLLIKLVLAFITAYRTSLETGKPIFQSLAHVTPDAVWLILISLMIVILTIWKARGGNAFGTQMPYSPYWGEAHVDRPYQMALKQSEEAKEHHHRQIIEDIYEETGHQLDQVVTEAEEKLKQLYIDTIKANQRALRHEQVLRNLRTDTKADLDLYETAVRQSKGSALVAPVTLTTPTLLDVQKILSDALRAAEERLVALRHTVADLAQPLTEARAEAVAQLDLMFRDYVTRAYTAQGLPLEEPHNA